MFRTQGRKEIAETVITAALCALVEAAIYFAADCWRRRAGVWRCPECNKTHEPKKEKNPE